MQTLLVGSGCKQLIEQGKTTSLRGLYYMLKHTIDGTNEETFDEQSECDTIIEDFGSHARRPARGTAPVRQEARLDRRTHHLVDSGDEIDCSRMGSGGYTIPSICEPEIVQFKKNEAKFILHVEKDTVWRRFNEDKFWVKHNCILTHGGGQPPRGVRRLLHRLHNELKLPVYCLLDNDPWGYYIYSVIKQGSINLAYESQADGDPRGQVPWIAQQRLRTLRTVPQRQIKLNDTDIKRARQIARYPWFEKKKAWQKEIETDALQRIQVGGRVADQQGHQLRLRTIRPRPTPRPRFPGLVAEPQKTGGAIPPVLFTVLVAVAMLGTNRNRSQSDPFPASQLARSLPSRQLGPIPPTIQNDGHGFTDSQIGHEIAFMSVDIDLSPAQFIDHKRTYSDGTAGLIGENHPQPPRLGVFQLEIELITFGLRPFFVNHSSFDSVEAAHQPNSFLGFGVRTGPADHHAPQCYHQHCPNTVLKPHDCLPFRLLVNAMVCASFPATVGTRGGNIRSQIGCGIRQ